MMPPKKFKKWLLLLSNVNDQTNSLLFSILASKSSLIRYDKKKIDKFIKQKLICDSDFSYCPGSPFLMASIRQKWAMFGLGFKRGNGSLFKFFSPFDWVYAANWVSKGSRAQWSTNQSAIILKKFTYRCPLLKRQMEENKKSYAEAYAPNISHLHKINRLQFYIFFLFSIDNKRNISFP